MLGTEHQVRTATMADHEAVAQVLGRAFTDDPLLHWVFDRPELRAESGVQFFRWWTASLIDQGVTWTTHGHGGAAVWALPGQWQPSAMAQLRLVRQVRRGVRHPARVLRGLVGLERKHPKDVHLYLALLGVDPSEQGSGLGSALISEGLRVADEERWPAYLESSNPDNLNFYARHGFEVIEEVRFPRGGPPVFRCRREPR